jgi:predicted DCC family thiol-disulfide oxidoreductase YuxK
MQRIARERAATNVSGIEGRERGGFERSAARVRRDVMIVPVREPLILFDGVCNLCNVWVRFVIRHDPGGVFRFAAQQSPTGQAIIMEHVSGAGQLSSVMLIENNGVYTESDAVLQILSRLGPPCSWIALARIIPRRVRDACYRFIVRHRYQWFGRTEVCQVPSADMRSRFIE